MTQPSLQPQLAHHSSSSGLQLAHRNLEIHCLVVGEDAANVFPVKISKSETVGILKEMIKEKKKPQFDDFAADTLVLWKVSIPDNDNLQQNLDTLNLNEGSEQHLQLRMWYYLWLFQSLILFNQVP